jgi:hypothetical protein
VGDPFDVANSGPFHVTCQIMHVEPTDHGTTIDLVTIAPCRHGGNDVPPGTVFAFALGFGSERRENTREALEAVMLHWETAGSVLDVGVDEVPGGLRYQFTCDADELVLLVDGGPSDA